MNSEIMLFLVVVGFLGAIINMVTLHHELMKFWLTRAIVKTKLGKIVVDIALPGLAMSFVAGQVGFHLACLLLAAMAAADLYFVWFAEAKEKWL